MKSAETSLLDFLKANPSVYASGDLQRMGFKNKNGTLATPRSIVRRLEENAEAGGVLQVSYDDHGNAQYSIKSEFRKKEQHVDFILRDGVRYAHVTYA